GGEDEVELREEDDRARRRLRLAARLRLALAGEGALDDDRPGTEVDVAPLQRQHLAEPQSAVGGEREGCPPALAPSGADERGDLLRGQAADLLRPSLRGDLPRLQPVT